MTKTRRKGEGSIRKRADGSWEFRLKGKSYYFKTEKEAVKEGRKISQKAETCDLSRDGITFGELSQTWSDNKKESTKPSTWQTYEYGREKLSPLNKRKAAGLKADDFQKIFNAMGKIYSERYIAKTKEVAYGIMEFAEDNDVILRNPVKKCTIPATANESKEKVPFTEEELAILMKELPDISNGDIPYLLLETGARGQELVALDDKCLQYIDGQCCLSIHQAMSREGGTWVISKTKTKNGKRLVPIGTTAEMMIKKRMVASASNHLFVNRQGEVINYTTFRNIYKSVLEKIDCVQYRPPHCCRHTYATKLYLNKVDKLAAQKLLGHADYTTTAKVYTHIEDQQLIKSIMKSS